MRSIGLYVFSLSYTTGVLALALASVGWKYEIGFVGMFVVLVFSVWRLHAPTAHLLLAASLGTALACTRMTFVVTHMPDAFIPLLDQKVTLTGTVVSLPDNRETSDRLMVEVKQGIEKTRIIAAVPSYPTIHVGDIISVSGTPKKPEPFETDGGRIFEYPNFLRKDGVFAVMQPAYAKRIKESNNPWLRFLRALEWFKNHFMHLIGQALPEPESALAAGLLVGGKQGLGDRLIDAFTRAGMLQIVVLSGYNVMIVADTILKGLKRFPKNIALLIASTSIACFVLIAGAGSSALRAGVMAFFALYARATDKQYEVMRILMATLVVIGLWNPLLLVFDPGFQFSFIATLGLVIGVPVIAPKLLFLRSTLLIELVSTTLAAEVALLPFLLWQTGNLSLVSVFANVVAMPVIPFCMAASVVAAMFTMPLGVVSSMLSVVVGLPAYLGLAYVITIATVSSSLPFATVIIPAFPFWVVVVSYALIGLLVRHQYAKLPHDRAGVRMKQN